MPWKEPYKTKRGIKYRVRWRQGGKQRHVKAGVYAKTANTIIQNLETSLALNPGSISSLKLSECVKQYLYVMEKTVQPRTADIARTSLVPLVKEFGSKLANEIKTEQIEKFKNKLLEVRKSNGINIVLRNVKTFFEFCVRNGYLESNPAKQIKKFKDIEVARFLNRKELSVLYRPASKKLRKAIFVFYNTGMRRGEFLGVKLSDIGTQEVHVSGKTGSRNIPLRPLVRKILIRVAGTWTQDGLESAFRMAVKRAGMGRIRVHDLRHTFASAYLKSGGTLADLRFIGGWKSLTALQIYAHFQRNYLTERMMRVRL